MSILRMENVFSLGVKKGVYVLLLFLTTPSLVSAGAYTTSVSPSGTQIPSPITVTFTIQDFAERDFGSSCTTGFIPGEIGFNYWFDQGLDFNEIQPPVIPTSEMIESGIYTAVLNLPVGQAVDSIGAEFFQSEGSGGIKCGFYGRQPDGVSEEPWSEPAFTVIAAPATVYISSPSFRNQAPSASFTAFPVGKILSGKKEITYSADDPDGAPFGLKDFPISLYLSNDGGTIWKELVKNEPNKESYSLDTNNFPDGTNYKLKVVALDNDNQSGEAVSGTFGIDNTMPSFEVSIDAEVIREKDKISLKVVSSESLIETPVIQITQSGGEPQTLIVDGFGKKFSASYTTVKGHVGTAAVSIKGKDMAGNTGVTITSGGSFMVSRLGPPPPVIKNVIDNESFSEQNINIFGSAPAARKVILVFNKKETMTVTPDENGDFSFKSIVLSSSDFGRNTLGFSSVDKDGLESDPRVLTVKLNSPPTVSWAVRPSGAVSGVTHLEWETRDANNDELISSLWYSIGGGKNWDFISKGLLTNYYELNTGEFFDGEYLLKILVDDGTITSSVASEKLVFRNNNLFSITNAPRNYTFDTTQPVFKGEVRVSRNAIASLKYSLEKELWMSAEAVDGKFDSSSERFSITFPASFIDGRHTVFIEAADDTGATFRTFQTFIIDTLPPVPASIIFPSADDTISASRDSDPTLGGIQIDVTGKAEAGADLELEVNNRVYTASADGQGSFIFKKVTFLSRGINRYVLSSSDAVGNLSSVEGLLLSNSAPTLSFVTAQKGDFLQGTKEVRWKASDGDDDALIFQISYRRKGDKKWVPLGSDITADSYKMDVSAFKEGAYELQVTANDGLTETAVTEEVFIDNVLPTIKFDSAGSRTVSKIKLIFSGSAEDNLSGVKFVEYSLDGKSWFKAIIAEGYLQKKAFFVIRHPFELEDGVYDFGVRAVDAAGNISKPIFEKIVVDSTPPRIGSFLISYKNMTVFPTDGIFEIPSATPLHFVVSLENDTQDASLSLSSTQRFNLLKNKSSGLWETDFSTDRQGTSTISITAEDVFGNSIKNMAIGRIKTIPHGRTVAGAKITVLLRREDRSLIAWPADAYRAENPVWSDENGEYTLVLPAGRYQLLVEKPKYQRLRVSDFEVLTPHFIGLDFSLKPRTGLRGFLEGVLERVSF